MEIQVVVEFYGVYIILIFMFLSRDTTCKKTLQELNFVPMVVLHAERHLILILHYSKLFLRCWDFLQV